MKYLILLFFLLNGYLYSQVEIIKGKGIDSLINLRCNKTKSVNYMIPGWRVQLHFSTEKTKLKKLERSL